jgi:hypothetical protein
MEITLNSNEFLVYFSGYLKPNSSMKGAKITPTRNNNPFGVTNTNDLSTSLNGIPNIVKKVLIQIFKKFENKRIIIKAIKK